MSEVALKISFLSMLSVSDKTYIKVLFGKKDGGDPKFCVSPIVGGEFCGDLPQQQGKKSEFISDESLFTQDYEIYFFYPQEEVI